jgi:ATP-dependent RNA helicase DDX24/MAK5
VVAVQNNPIIIDVTGHNLAKVEAANKKEKNKNINNDDDEEDEDYDKTEELLATLPKGLEQFQVSVPTDDKDMMTYHCLIKHSGRTLLFVNSIKTARRVDGLLRALGLNCRTIHAQLQQRQRLRALEAFRSSPIGVLVATDVAARGLDIPKITTVLHYDVARSSQVYIHRSGRTARANMTGRTISLVAPEDTVHHNAILKAQALTTLPLFKPDNAALPLLRDRVKLAKKIFTQSFILSQGTKENTWIKQNSTEADVELDDYMIEEIGTKEKQQQVHAKAKKALDKLKFVSILLMLF